MGLGVQELNLADNGSKNWAIMLFFCRKTAKRAKIEGLVEGSTLELWDHLGGLLPLLVVLGGRPG